MCKERNYIPLYPPCIKKEITHEVDTSCSHSRSLIRSAWNVASHLYMVWKFDKVSFLQTHLDTSPAQPPIHDRWTYLEASFLLEIAIVAYVSTLKILDLDFSIVIGYQDAMSNQVFVHGFLVQRFSTQKKLAKIQFLYTTKKRLTLAIIVGR